MEIKKKQLIKEVLNRQMDNLQKQYQKVRQEEKDLIENTRRKIINNQAKLQEEYQNYQELETLREELEDVDRSLEFFDDLDLVNMWLFDTSIEEAAEYLIENQGEWEEQWLMGLSIKLEESGKHRLRVVVKTSESPYVDGMEIDFQVIKGQIELEPSYYENSPDLMAVRKKTA